MSLKLGLGLGLMARAGVASSLALSEIVTGVAAHQTTVIQHQGVHIWPTFVAPANIVPVRDLTYTWNLNKPGNPQWSYLDADFPYPGYAFNDANVHYGMFGKVCYDQPGVYNPTVLIEWTNPQTGIREATIQTIEITVTDWNVYYAGNKTVVVDTTGLFTNLPSNLSGATQVTSVAAAHALLDSSNPAERCLYKTGQSFEAVRDTAVNKITRAGKTFCFGTWYDSTIDPTLQPHFRFESTARDGNNSAMNVLNVEVDAAVIVYQVDCFGLYDATTASTDSAFLRFFFTANSIGVTINDCVCDGITLPVHVTSGGAVQGSDDLADPSWALIYNCEFGRLKGWYDYGSGLGNDISCVGVRAEQPPGTLSGAGGKNPDLPNGQLFADHGPLRLTTIYQTCVQWCQFWSRNGWSTDGLAFQAGIRWNMTCRRGWGTIMMCLLRGGVSQLALTRTTENVYVYPAYVTVDRVWMEGDHETVRSIHIGNGGVTISNVSTLKRDEVDTWNRYARIFEIENFPGGGDPAALNNPISIRHMTAQSFESDPAGALEFIELSGDTPWPGPITTADNVVNAPNATNSGDFTDYGPLDANGVPQTGSAAISASGSPNVLYDITGKQRGLTSTVGAFDVEVTTTVTEEAFFAFNTTNPGTGVTIPVTVGDGTAIVGVYFRASSGDTANNVSTFTLNGQTGSLIGNIQLTTSKFMELRRFDNVTAGTVDLVLASGAGTFGRLGGVVWTLGGAGTISLTSGTTNLLPSDLSISGPALVAGGALLIYTGNGNNGSPKTLNHTSDGPTLIEKHVGIINGNSNHTASQVIPTVATAAGSYSIGHSQVSDDGSTSETITGIVVVEPEQ